MSEPSFREFLALSLEALRRECGAAHAAMCAGLTGRLVRLRVGDESFGLRFARDHVALVGAPDEEAIEVVTDRRTILDIIGGRRTLLEAVFEERMELRGAPEELLRFHDALLSYLAGAVRSPSFPPLLAAYSQGERA